MVQRPAGDLPAAAHGCARHPHCSQPIKYGGISGFPQDDAILTIESPKRPLEILAEWIFAALGILGLNTMFREGYRSLKICGRSGIVWSAMGVRGQMVSDASSDRSAPTERHGEKHSPLFLAVFAALLIATMICVAGMLTGVFSARPSHHDTQWFWVSGRLLMHGANPYDREAVRQMELALGLPVKGPDVPMLRNPPTALFLMVPMGLLGPRPAVLAWSLMLALCLAVSVLAVR